jgi:hypothetical protein
LGANLTYHPTHPAHAHPQVLSIRCYQCSSDEDKTSDSCGAYDPFDATKNSPVDCMAEDAVTPGTFCYKSIQQGPRGFIWDGRWRTVIRRCAQISERGISWGCDWGFHENGVYWEECYCAEDGCNGATSVLATGGSASIPAHLIMTVLVSVALASLAFSSHHLGGGS